MAEDGFRDIDDLTSEEEYPTRKSAAEKQLEEELQKDTAEISESERKKEVSSNSSEKTLKNPDSKPKKQNTRVQKTNSSVSNKKPTKVKPKKKPVPKKETPKVAVRKKKTAKKQGSKREVPKTIIVNEEKDNWVLIAASSIVIVAVIVALYFVFSAVQPNTQADTVAAVVNGIPIYNSKVDFRVKALESSGIQPNRTAALNQLIDEQLVVQEAKNLGYSVSKSQAEELLSGIIANSGMSTAQFATKLNETGISYDQMIEYYKDASLISEYINTTLGANINITGVDAKEYYDNHASEFQTPQRYQVRHILIGYDNMSQNETHEKAKAIAGMINKNRSNFCDLVKNYSTDIASIQTCGEYNFSMSDPFVQEFKTVGEQMKPGDIGVVASQFGYHVIWKIANIPSETVSFETAKDSIIALLKRQKLLDAYTEKVAELKNSSLIEIYTDKGSRVYNSSATKSNTDNNQTALTQSNTTASNTVVKETVPTSESKMKKFVSCLDNVGTKMYSVYWSPDTNIQLGYFNEYNSSIKVIECDKESSDYNSACDNKSFNVYPTWVINGKEYSGVQSLVKLSEYSGCAY